MLIGYARVYIAKNRMVLDQSLPATITATILGLAAQIEREFISARTKESEGGSGLSGRFRAYGAELDFGLAGRGNLASLSI